MKIITCLVMVLLLSFVVFPAQMQNTTTDPSAVVVPDTQTIDLTSTTNGNDYRITVALPASYASSEQTYPVLYVLDPLITFLSTTEMVRFLSWVGQLPELIVVGIGYPTNDLTEATSLRDRDYSRFEGEFLTFIDEELFPLVDATYRTNSADRGLIGFSSGGAFAFHVLVERPELFNRYVTIDGDNPTALREVLSAEDELRSQFVGRDVRLFIASSGTDYYAAGIQAKEYDGLTATGLSLGGVPHSQALYLSLPAGIIAIYAN
jgi:predicted alpha/beta superfamily hydrolase